MWSGTVDLAEMLTRGRFDVGAFVARATRPDSGVNPVLQVGTVVKERKEFIDPADFGQTIQYLGLENIESLTGEVVGESLRPGNEIVSRCKLFRSGDILYGRLRPYLNKVYLADDPVASGMCSPEFYVLTPDVSKIRPRVLRALLASRYVQDYVGQWQTGSALPRLRLDDLLGLWLPVPSIEVQSLLEEYLLTNSLKLRALRREVHELPRRMVETMLEAVELGDLGAVLDS